MSLVALTGAFGGSTDTSVCDAYRAEIKGINERNAIKIAECERLYQIYAPIAQAWYVSYIAYMNSASEAHKDDCNIPCSIVCTPDSGSSCGFSCYGCRRDVQYQIDAGAPVMPEAPICPELETWGSSDGCGSETPPDCPPGKKVWLQVLWGSPGGKASDAKGCFIVAYSQDSADLPSVIEYNPFLPIPFVNNQAMDYNSVIGNKLAGIDTTLWEDLDSTKGWDKGYWAAESVHPECRGWRPGWSLKIK